MRNDLDRMGSTLGKVKKPLKKKEEGNKVTYDAQGGMQYLIYLFSYFFPLQQELQFWIHIL